MSKAIFLLWILVCAFAGHGQNATQGSLFATDAKGVELGACPLKTTAVKADVSGFLARVTVRQEFENKFDAAIEAVYVFPLSQNGAVDRMTMTVGTRTIHGKIMKREEARQTYETARSEGKTAALLDQERTNIFTQSVANIMPGETVVVEISYVETLKYEDGAYEFVFPMTVAPRYMPAGVRDANRIAPPTAEPTRGGHDISIEVNLNAGVPVEAIRSSSHDIDQTNFTPATARVTLRDEKVIPNKDFILRYDVTGKRIEDAVLTHADSRGGFFTLMLQPPDKIATEDRTPKEIVFVLDTSGSMEGFPIEKAKEAMRLSLEGLYPEDTFNLITFAGDTDILFDKPVPATQANLEKAQAFIAGRNGNGGTEMMKAIKAALEPSDAADHLRIVCFMTDGEVGNDDEIVAEVQRHPQARVFSFGIGSSVNRSLLDRIAQEGKGEAEYVALEDDGSKAARKFYERVRTPLLTDLSIDWNGLPVADVYPNRLSDLFSAKPVIVHGRFTKAATGTITLRGKVAGQPYERPIRIALPESEPANDVLATLWARQRIDDITSARLKAANEKQGAELDAQVTNIGIEFGLLTSFTSFVAVEDRVVNQNGTPTRVEVPVEAPAGTTGVEREDDTPFRKLQIITGLQQPPTVTFSNGTGSGGGGGGGVTVKQAAKNKIRIVTKSGPSRGSISGSGSGGGLGSGSGTGSSGIVTGNGSSSSADAPPPPAASATVDVTSNEVVSVDADVQATVITTKSLTNLPINGRRLTSFVTRTPGAASKKDGGEFVLDGTSGVENSYILDGTELKARGFNGDHLDGKTVLVVRPEYPSRRRLAGFATVDVSVDTLGNVVAAKTTGVGAAFRASAEKAALQTKFAPVLADGKAVRVAGTLVYRFNRNRTVTIALRSMKAVAATDAEYRLSKLNEKLHFWIAALVRRLADPTLKPSPNEEKFVQNGKASISVDLKAATPATLEKLKAAGFELASTKGKTVIGTIDAGKIASLAELDEVTLILPHI